MAAFYPQTDTFSEWTRGDLNPWPPPCEGGALPTELRAHKASAIVAAGFRIARQGAKGVSAATGIMKNTLVGMCVISYTSNMDEPGRSMYPVEWLRKGEMRGFFPPALRDRNGHRYYTEEDIERMRNRPTSNRR